MSNPYLPFPGADSDGKPSNSKKAEKKNGSTIYNETLKSTLKQRQKIKPNGSIKYNIDDNKCKTKFNEIIKDKIVNNSTHNLIHNPSIQRHQIKKPSSILKNGNKHNTNPSEEKWKCSVCTYMNIAVMAYCEICETKKVVDDDDNHNQYPNENQEEKQHIETDDDDDVDLSLSLNITQIDHDHDDDDEENSNNQKMSDAEFARQLMMEESQSVPNYNKRSYSEDEEIAKKLQKEMNEAKEMEQCKVRQKQLEDEYLAKKLQAEIEKEERAHKLNKQMEDELIAKRLQQEHDEELLKLEKAKQENEAAALEIQAKEDMDAAKYYEEKQKEDEKRLRDDESFALKMQQELNKGAAWFCNGCFAMNMDITKFKCSLCATIRPKPSIPKYIMAMKDDLSTDILGAIRQVPGHIVNVTFVQNFVIKYFKMCEEIGHKLAYPKIVYHWTKSANFDAISKTGLKVPDGVNIRHQTDTGYYGRGIYTSPDPKYAQSYGWGANKLFVCLSLPGRQYKASYPAMLGKPLQEGYDSHVSKDRNEMEWVFFTTEQLLLCYLVTLDFLENEAKDQMDYVCQLLESKFLGLREERLSKLTKDDV